MTERARVLAPALGPAEPPGWARDFPVSYQVTLAVDADGSIALAGTFMSTADLGTGLLVCPGGGQCPFITRLAPDGTTVFAKALFRATATGGTPTGLAVDGGGNIIMTGTLPAGSTFDCGAGPIQAGPTAQSVFFAKLTPTGTCSWSVGGGVTGSATTTTLHTDAAGDIVTSGWLNRSVHFGSTTVGDAEHR